MQLDFGKRERSTGVKREYSHVDRIVVEYAKPHDAQLLQT